MRQHYIPYTQDDRIKARELRALIKIEGLTRHEAAARVGVHTSHANYLLSRSFPSPAEMKDRRKDHIVKVLTDKKKNLIAKDPRSLAAWFKVDESFVEQMIVELRDEGRLPKITVDQDTIYQNRIIKCLQKHYPNVYRAHITGQRLKVGDKLMVAGKGWLNWEEAEILANKHCKNIGTS